MYSYLSRRSNGYFYLWTVHDDEFKSKVSTGVRSKRESLRYLAANSSIYAVQHLLGYADVAMTKVYAHLATEGLQDAVAKLPFLGL